MMFRILNKNKGFTLIEVMIVIAIIGILSAIFILNYQSFRRQLALKRSAVKLAQDIRRTEEMAIGMEECLTCPGGTPETGYGIYFDERLENGEKYHIYADTAGGNEFFTSADTILETIALEKDIFISSITPNKKVSINFAPPDPVVKIKSVLGDKLSSVTITLCIKGTNCGDAKNTAEITVNKAGLISVK